MWVTTHPHTHNTSKNCSNRNIFVALDGYILAGVKASAFYTYIFSPSNTSSVANGVY